VRVSPKISFVIPTYNCVTWLPHAVSSCLQQTVRDIEVVVVDDGSTDRTVEYLKWLENDPRVHIIRQKNMGRSAARNAGNLRATADIIAVLDADDISTPNRAELTLKKFAGGKVDFVHGAATIIDAIGNPSAVLSPDVFDREKAIEEMKNLIVHSTVAYKRDLALRFPYRNEASALGVDDWAQQIEASIGGAVIDFVPHRLACYRILENQVTQTRDKEAVKAFKTKFLESLKVPA
jgi:glycosyltransferase involved in cell wall biosynthesis